MSTVSINKSCLDIKDGRSYFLLPIPSDTDDAISGFLNAWLALNSEQKREVANSLTKGQLDVLKAYSERMASRAVREQNKQWIVLGLIAANVDAWRVDWRDNVLVVTLHYNACERLGISANDVFSEAAAVLPLNVSRAFTLFLKRDPADKTLESMGYVASTDSDGFRYQRNW